MIKTLTINNQQYLATLTKEISPEWTAFEKVFQETGLPNTKEKYYYSLLRVISEKSPFLRESFGNEFVGQRFDYEGKVFEIQEGGSVVREVL